jgi:hypothetical protein
MSDFTKAELCAVALAECFRGDGEILASAIGVLPTLGARLAKLSWGRQTASSPSSKAGCPIAASSICSGPGDATW